MTVSSNLVSNPTAANSGAASLTANIKKRFDKFIDALTEHADVASQMTTRQGTNKFVSRWEYHFRNVASGAWADLYGNTTDKQLPMDKVERDDDRTRFCARLNLAYEENRLAEFYSEEPILDSQGNFIAFRGHPECNPNSTFYDEEAAMNNIEHLNLVGAVDEARDNFAARVALFNYAIGTYEELTGTEFEYVPYNVTKKTPNGAEGARAVGLAALKRMQQRNAA